MDAKLGNKTRRWSSTSKFSRKGHGINMEKSRRFPEEEDTRITNGTI